MIFPSPQGRLRDPNNTSGDLRKDTAWYRHITLAMLAHGYLSATRATAEKGGLQPEPAS